MVNGRSNVTKKTLLKAVENMKNGLDCPIIVYDLETTGLDSKKNVPIQFAAIKVNVQDGRLHVLDSYQTYINPEIPIPEKITELTGITDDMLMNERMENNIFPEIKAFIGEKFIASGYNIAKFDNAFMEQMYARHNAVYTPVDTVDVLDMARDLVPYKNVENFKLGTIASLYGADKGLTFHNAMDDVTATKRLLFTMYNEYVEDEENSHNQEEKELIKVSRISRISFWEGHKGFSRIYVSTDAGELYFDIRTKTWNVQKSNLHTLDEFDFPFFLQKVFEKANVKTEQELIHKITPHKEERVIIVPTKVNSIKRWTKQVSDTKTLNRLYIHTDVGEFYYDILKKCWVVDTGNPNETIDVDALKALVYSVAHVSTDEELKNFK